MLLWVPARQSKDGAEALVCAVTQDISILDRNAYVRLRGLEAEALYEIPQTGQRLSGAALSQIGLLLPHTQPQYSAFVFDLKKV